MAVSESSLSSAIKSNVRACGFTVSGENACFIEAIAKAVVAEIKKGEVEVTVAGGSSAGKHTGIIQ